MRIGFSEPVEPFGEGISVLGPAGRRVDRRPVRVAGSALGVDVDASSEGTYLVQWEVISGDTHPTRGSFAFNVGHPGGLAATLASEGTSSELGAVDPIGLTLQVAARWLHFLGYALSFGVIAFQLFVLRPVGWLPRHRSPTGLERGDHGGTAPTTPDSEGAVPPWLSPSGVSSLSRLIAVGLLALLLAEPLALLGQTASLGANQMLDPATMSAALDSSFGRAQGERVGAAVLLWVLLGIVRSGSPGAISLTLVLGGALAVLDGGSAHAGSVRPAAAGFLINALHLSAMGVWAGGLVALVTIWPFLNRAENARLRSKVLERFGRMAFASFGVLAMTGVGLAVLHLTNVANLVATPYGAVLLVKIVVTFIAVSIALAAMVTRRRQLRRWWTVEALGALGILLLAGLVVSLPPPT